MVGTISLRHLKLDAQYVNDHKVFKDHSSLKLGEVKRLFVNPKGRGKAIGKELMLHLISKAKDLGYQKLFLDSCERYCSF